jgi:putative membrane protein
MMHWGDDWWSWWWMPVGMVLFWVLVTIVIVLVVRMLGRPSDPSPHAVLDERYARGEIDDEEYRRRRATMRELHGGR